MKIKNQYTIIKIRHNLNGDQEQAALLTITQPVVVIDLRHGKPWVVVRPRQEEEDIPKLTGYHAVAKPKTTDPAYPPEYITLLPSFFGCRWTVRGTSSVIQIMDVNAIREFEFPNPPPPKDEIEKLGRLMISIRKIIKLRDQANRLLEEMHHAIAYRVVVEGKPLSQEGEQPEAGPNPHPLLNTL